MANFVLCADPDRDRCRRFIDAVGPRLAIFPDLVHGAISCGDLQGAWAAAARAPVAAVNDDSGAAVVFGEVIDAVGRRLSPAALRSHWSTPDTLRTEFDGYYAAGARLANGQIVVGVDRLGMFPLYYYSAGGVLLVGSSPETFELHPAFRRAFNPAGLVGILLTNGVFEGETLLSNVKRLGQGHLLVWNADDPVHEVSAYEVPLTDRYLRLSLADHLDIMDDGMRQVMARQAPAGRPYSMLLSGGLDSRTLGGYMQRAGLETTAVTLGQTSDLEMKCARRVARALAMPQRTAELDTSRFEEYARIHTDWDHCAAGSSLLMDWGMAEHVSNVPTPCVAGLGLDWVLGGHAPTVPDLSFEKFFEYQNRWGLAPKLLRPLLRCDVFGDLVDESMRRIEATYRGYSDLEWRRAWSFSVRHRNRFHIGSEAWRISFGAWPILPAGDGLVIELGGGLPPVSAADRRAQYELLKTKFPALAALPLDRNTSDTTPLLPTSRWLLTRRFIDPLTRVRDGVTRRLGGRTERRRYYRVFDINSPEWTKVRALAEPYRRTVGYEFFEAKALDALLPPPDASIPYRDGITDVAGIKTILAFLIWAHDHHLPG